MTRRTSTRHSVPARNDDLINRRTALATLTTVGATALAGCAGIDDDTDDGDSQDEDDAGDSGEDDGLEGPDLPRVEDPPDAVYIPTHREGMMMPDPVMAGDLMVAPMVSYPHNFWLVSGASTEAVSVTEDDDVHLMLTIWDPETGTVISTDEGTSMEISKDGELVESRAPWVMLSQSMGAHLGDNVPLDGEGTYTVDLTVPSVETALTGELAGRFSDSASASFEFTLDQDSLERMIDMIEWVDEEHWGERGAMEPSHGGGTDGSHGDGDNGGHAMPFANVPPAEELPGTFQEVATSGNADIAVAVVDEPGRFTDETPTLLVSPRSPYNRIPLPEMAMAVDVGGNSVDLVEALDHHAGHHYHAALPDLEPGSELTITVETPPQTARHQGYETAFVDMPSIEVAVDAW